MNKEKSLGRVKFLFIREKSMFLGKKIRYHRSFHFGHVKLSSWFDQGGVF